MKGRRRPARAGRCPRDPWVECKRRCYNAIRPHKYPISAHPCEKASERASWLVPTRTMEIAIDSAISKVGFEAEAREAIATFVSGNDVFVLLPIEHGKSFCYVLLPLVFDELFNCAFTLLLAGVLV